MNKYLTIQPSELNGRLPYPFYVEQTGTVSRQDFWKGKPARCIGFAQPGIYRIQISISDFFRCPDIELIKNLFPVFKDKDGEMWTMTSQWTGILIEEKEKEKAK